VKVETAKKLNHYVNQEGFMDALGGYIEDRIKMHHHSLETAVDSDGMKFYQGSLGELRRLYKLRTDTLAVLELEKKKNG
jgi:hypothetical protein